MSTTAAVSLEEYLRTDYAPDMEYIDGELVHRNLGTHYAGSCSCWLARTSFHFSGAIG